MPFAGAGSIDPAGENGKDLPPPASGGAEKPPLAGVFIALVEDDEAPPNSLLAFLEYAGAFVRVTAPSGTAALLAHVHPDVLLIAAARPDAVVAGLERALGRREVGIPIIALAAAEDLERLRAMTVDAVLRRPVNATELGEVIWRVVTTERPARTKPRILIAEDHDDSRELLAVLLRDYDVVLAADGSQAIERFQQDRPDLVIVDVLMPVKDGIETILAIRRLAPNARIIAVSGGWSHTGTTQSGGPDLLAEARYFGADVTLRKPLDPRLVLEAVEELLA
jgi:two-component system chemotaxis response regulator CheY